MEYHIGINRDVTVKATLNPLLHERFYGASNAAAIVSLKHRARTVSAFLLLLIRMRNVILFFLLNCLVGSSVIGRMCDGTKSAICMRVEVHTKGEKRRIYQRMGRVGLESQFLGLLSRFVLDAMSG